MAFALNPPAVPKVSFGGRAYMARKRARIYNVHDAAPLIAPAAWTSGETLGSTGNIRTNGGLYYANVNTGACGATAPTHMSSAAVSDGAVLWEFAWGPLAAPSGAAEIPAVTATGSASLPSGTTAIPLQAHTQALVSLRGCYASAYATSGLWLKRFNSNSATTVEGAATLRFISDAQTIAFAGHALATGYCVYVDGRPLQLDYIGSNMAGNYFHKLNWAYRKFRRYEIVWSIGESHIVGIATAAGDTTIADNEDADLSGVFIGDSYLAGSGYSPFLPGRSLPEVFGRKIGVDLWNMAVGGTGWINPGTGPYYSFGQRIAEALTRNPKIWFFYGSTNDINYSAAAITAAALSALQSIRAGGNMAPIVLIGPNPINTAGTLTIPQVESALQAAVTAFGDPQTFFMPSNGELPLTLGAWNNSAWTGFTNSANIIGGDNTHPAEIGVRNFAERWAAQYDALVLPNLW